MDWGDPLTMDECMSQDGARRLQERTEYDCSSKPISAEASLSWDRQRHQIGGNPTVLARRLVWCSRVLKIANMVEGPGVKPMTGDEVQGVPEV